MVRRKRGADDPEGREVLAGQFELAGHELGMPREKMTGRLVLPGDGHERRDPEAAGDEHDPRDSGHDLVTPRAQPLFAGGHPSRPAARAAGS